MNDVAKVMDLARFGEWSTSRTGKYQVTGLQALDDAVAAKISGLFSSVVSSGEAGGSHFATFLSRPPEARVFVGKFDDVSQTLRGIAQSTPAERQTLGGVGDVNSLALPLVNVSRAFNITYRNDDEGKSEWIPSGIKDSAGTPLADVFRQYAEMFYDVTFIASDKGTLSLMVNAMAAALFSMSDHKIMYTGAIMSQPLTMQAAIMTPKNINITDMSPGNGTKIFAGGLQIQVLAEIVSAWELDSVREVNNVGLGVIR